MGAETLIRWRHPERGLVSPIEFMPLVNASSISDRVALWVLETACRQGRQWQQMGHDVRLGVNLSPSQLQSGDLAATIAGGAEATRALRRGCSNSKSPKTSCWRTTKAR